MGFEDDDFYRAQAAMNENLYGGKDRSGTQLYKQAGNSIVVDVLLHIFENLYDVMPYLLEDIKVGSFFSGIGAFEKALTLLGEPRAEQTGDTRPDQLEQIGYINDYNGDANRIYDCSVARALKAEAGGGAQRPDGIDSLSERVYIKQATKQGFIECEVGGGGSVLSEQ